MKKAFNFRSVLVCVLVLIMCLTAFVACDKKQDLSGLENAKSQIYQTYKKLDNTTQASDFYLFKTIVVGEKTYNIDWSYKVLEGPEENVSLVLDSDKANFVKFAINGQASAETKFVINGYVKDEKGNKLVIAENGFTIKVPTFQTADYATIKKACDENSKDTFAFLGYIVGINAAIEKTYKSGSLGSMWVMDAQGHGLYVYNNAKDSASDMLPSDLTTREAINARYPFGAQVIIRGSVAKNNEVYQFGKGSTVTLTGKTAQSENVNLEYVDRTEMYGNATDSKDKALVETQSTLITLKNVVLGTNDGKEYNFTVNGKTFVFYMDQYLIDNATVSALEKKWVVGATANLKGLVNYFKQYQVYPNSIDSIEIVSAATDENVVDSVLAALKVASTIKGNIELPSSESVDSIVWTSNNANAVVNGNKVTITRTDEDQKVTFTATVKKGGVTKSKEFEAVIKAKEQVDIGFKGVDGVAYKLMLTQTNLSKDLFLEGSMSNYYFKTVEDATKAIDVYVETVSETDGTYRLFIQKGADATTKKYIDIVLKDSHINVLFVDSTTSTWTWNDDIKTYQIMVDGANRALGTYSTYNTMSAQKVDSKNSFFAQLYGKKPAAPVEKTDAEKVAEAKAALTLDVTSTGVSFKLPLVGENGATISWTSSNTDVITINGENAVVTAPEADTPVTLTAIIKIGDAQDTKEFPVTVTASIPEFDVTITQPAAGGTVEVKNGAEVVANGKVQQGTVLTITATPNDAQHELVAIKVNGKAIEAVDGVYSVKVTEAVEITAEFKEIKNVTVTIAAVENGKVEVKKGADAVENNAVLRDGDVLTITATAKAGYKVSAIKVNGEAIKGNTYTITGAEADGKVAITVETVEIPAMTIAEFKASANNTQARVTGIVTNIDSKATWIQDVDGNALYVYATGLKDVAVGKQVTLVGSKDEYKGLLQLKNVQVIKVEDTATVITATVLDEAGYKALVANDAGKLVSINGLVYVSGTATTDKGGSLTFKLGNTDVTVRVERGEAAALNTAVLSKLQAGNVINLKNVNVGWFNNAQIAVSQVEQIEVVWNVSAEIDKSEIIIGDTAKITAAINPNFMAATVGDITFESGNKDVATVDANGVVTGVAKGDAIITVKAGDKTTTVNIKVVATATEYTVNYTVGENGTITVKAGETDVKTGDKVVADTKLTVTVAPADGFRLASVTIGEGAADTSFAGKTSFELTITAETTFAVAFEIIPAVKEYTISFANADARESLNNDSQVWKSGDLVFTNLKGASTSNVANFTNPVRLYKNSTVKIEIANITKIVFEVNTKDKPIANLQNSLKGKGNVTVAGTTLTIEFDTPQSVLEFVCAEQIRLNSLTVYTA